jgi:hypothetical protein
MAGPRIADMNGCCGHLPRPLDAEMTMSTDSIPPPNGSSVPRSVPDPSKSNALCDQLLAETFLFSRFAVRRAVKLLPDRLGQSEQLALIAKCSIGSAIGIIAVTDHRGLVVKNAVLRGMRTTV